MSPLYQKNAKYDKETLIQASAFFVGYPPANDPLFNDSACSLNDEQYVNVKNIVLIKDIAAYTEEEFVTEMASDDYIFHMKPKREYTIPLEIKSIEKAKFKFVEF
jgi:hypothetical protein